MLFFKKKKIKIAINQMDVEKIVFFSTSQAIHIFFEFNKKKNKTFPLF